jgi:phosphate transport system substrate-binding protein
MTSVVAFDSRRRTCVSAVGGALCSGLLGSGALLGGCGTSAPLFGRTSTAAARPAGVDDAAPLATLLAGDANVLPAYRRARGARGALRLSGSSAMALLARAWAGAFTRVFADVNVDVVVKSSGAAIGDMSADPTTIGMTSRALNRTEREGYAARTGRAPLEIKVAIDALAIVVFKDNPLPSITIEQVERVFAAAPRTGAAIDRWGQFGIAGMPWAERRVHPVGFAPGRGAYDLMRELVLGGGDFAADVQAEPVATSVVQAVGVEPGAIGYASASLRTARTRLLPVHDRQGTPVAPDEAGAASGRYPLARNFYLHLGTGADAGQQALAREFMRFVLSREGQELAASAGAFALPAAVAREQTAALG